jgi:FAD/FMN-containing dehydrogenase
MLVGARPGRLRFMHTTTLSGALRSEGFTGRVVEPGDPGFDTARAGWNGAIDRFPSAVAYAGDADDVAAAIRLGVPFTIRGGGHSVSGRSVRDGALCIDLRELNAVSVEPVRGIVRVGGGALLSELDAATQEHGLAVPGGQISHTGVGGLTLGGGVGWLMRHHGLTIDSLIGAEVVLADGEIVHTDNHPDLFWALRGGGGDFGVVTRFEFQAHRVGPTVLGGALVFPWEQAREVFQMTRALMDEAPDALSACVVLVGGPAVVVAIAWSGDDFDEGERVIAPLRNAGPLADQVAPMPYVALQSMLDHTAPHGLNYYDKQHYLPEVSDGFIDTLLAEFVTAPTPQSHVITAWLGGAIDRGGDTAFSHRGARAMSWLIGCSGDEPVEPTTEWVRQAFNATEPFATGGVYVNALDLGRSVREAYADDVWERLVEVKRRYDPHGVFNAHGIRA